MLSRFFNDEPARDGMEHAGRLVGNVIGFGIMAMMLWVALQGWFWDQTVPIGSRPRAGTVT